MTVSSGDRAAQSGHRARRWGRLMRKRELARGWRPSPLAGRTVAGGVGEQVIGAGYELAGDRRGGDLAAAAAGDGLVAGGEVRVPLGRLRRLAQHPPGPGRALLGDVPVADGAVAAADSRGKAGQAASLRADPNRVMSPISASRTSAVNGPTPGSWVRTLTRGSAFAR